MRRVEPWWLPSAMHVNRKELHQLAASVDMNMNTYVGTYLCGCCDTGWSSDQRAG